MLHTGRLPCGSCAYERENLAHAPIKEAGSPDTAENNHGVEAHNAPLEKVEEGHLVPTVIVGIAYDEPREGEEKVNGQVAVV